VTARERAEEIARKIGSTAIWETDIEIVEQAITAAVGAEREACAKVLDRHIKKYENTHWETHRSGFRQISEEYSAQARALYLAAQEIRARSEEEGKGRNDRY
jgi:hypothetical protein